LKKNSLSHIAFILDGNQRWAKNNKLNNIEGYKKGFENIKIIINYCLINNINSLTLFTLSSENFRRPSIKLIYDIIYNNFNSLIKELVNSKKVKIKIFGSRENLPKKNYRNV